MVNIKRVIRCLGCGEVKRFYGSYAVRLKDHTKNILTGEVKEVEYEGKVCRRCSRMAGYKVKEKEVKQIDK